jgi:hypothetical protein
MEESRGDKIVNVMMWMGNCNTALLRVDESVERIRASNIDGPGKEGLLAGIQAAQEEWLLEKEKWMNHRLWKNLPNNK